MDKSPLRTIAEAYQERLQLSQEDSLVFEYIVSVMTATMCKKLDEPVWVYIIAPPGSSKTESVKPYQGYEHCIFLSSLTDNWLMSGYRDDDGNDPSLINLLDGKILIVKDISSLANLPPRTINKIWGDLRDAFDQTASKASGVSGLTEYKARFGVIMLGTGALDIFAEEHQQLGERFLAFRLHRIPMGLEQRQELAMHVSRSMKDKDKWQSELKTIVQTEMQKINDKVVEQSAIPSVEESTIYLVMLMGNLLSLLRTTPVRGMAESPELPSRVGQQLLNLGMAHAIADSRVDWDESDTNLVRRVTIDTLPAFRSRLVKALYQRGKHRPFTTVNRIMEQCDETGESYRLSQKIYDAINQTGIL
jgi:hypothetical protein